MWDNDSILSKAFIYNLKFIKIICRNFIILISVFKMAPNILRQHPFGSFFSGHRPQNKQKIRLQRNLIFII